MARAAFLAAVLLLLAGAAASAGTIPVPSGLACPAQIASSDSPYNLLSGFVQTASDDGSIASTSCRYVAADGHALGEIYINWAHGKGVTFSGTCAAAKDTTSTSVIGNNGSTASKNAQVTGTFSEGSLPGLQPFLTATKALVTAAEPLAQPCAGVKTTTTTTPATTTTTTQSGSLVLRWAMRARFGGDANHDHLVDYMTTREQIDPGEWSAAFDVQRGGGAACDPTATYTWKIDGEPAELDPLGTCIFVWDHFKTLGKHTVAVTATKGATKETGELAVKLQDFLIVGLGDSNGSGEGNPDYSSALTPRWENERCHRSAGSFEARAAAAVEQADAESSVTFVHLACSGGSIEHGLVGPYRGLIDPGGDTIESQLSALQRLLGGRHPDAVIVSAGVNDLSFGKLVVFCLDQFACNKARFPNASSRETLAQYEQGRIKALPGLYANLAARFDRLGIKPGQVYITQYFDSLRDSAGNFCDPLIALGPKVFSEGEAAWAYESVLAPLNAAVAAAARKYGWNLVSGADRGFHRHGYCASNSWIVTVSDSLLTQGLVGEGAAAGALHANQKGQLFDAGLLIAALKKDGIP